MALERLALGADIMTVFSLTTMREFVPYDLAADSHLRAYLARIAVRPADRRAMARAEPDGPTLEERIEQTR